MAVLPENDFIVRIGTRFALNGRQFFAIGSNSYYQMTYRRWNAPGPDEVLDKLQARGMNVVRVFAFQDAVEKGAGLQCVPARQLAAGERPIDFADEQTLVALDQTLAAADARGLRVMLALVNNWTDYGGMDRWTLWRFGKVDHDRFFTDPLIRDWYRQLCSLLANRVNLVNGRVYRDDPTIFAWELTNEARASAGVALAVDAWIGEMSAHLKSVDPNHMVTTGIEGFYGPGLEARNSDSWMSSCGTDFIANHQHPTIDFATCHLWPENWKWNPIRRTDSALAKARRFLQLRLADAAALGKPLVCEEFGVPRDNHGRGLGSGSTHIRDEFFGEIHELFANAARSGGALGGLLNWQILHDGYSQYDDGNGIFLPTDASTDALITSSAREFAGIDGYTFPIG